MTEPSADVARGYFPQDKARHFADAPKHCPACGATFALRDGGRGIAIEFWEQDRRVFACYCASCGWAGDVVLTERVVGHEPEH